MKSFEQRRDIIRTFDEISAGYDGSASRFFWTCARRLVERAGIRPGDRVLDVGTGTGACALAAAVAVGPGGTVHAVDLSPEMVARARQNADRAGLANLEIREGDAESLDYRDGDFDAVLSSSALFFVPDMDRAVREFRRVLRDGGRLGVSAYSELAFQPMTGLYSELLRRYGVEILARPRERLDRPDKLRALLEDAGFAGVDIAGEQVGYFIEGAEQWWDLVWNSGMRRWLMLIPSERHEEFRREHLEQVARLRGEEGLRLDVSALFAHGTR